MIRNRIPSSPATQGGTASHCGWAVGGATTHTNCTPGVSRRAISRRAVARKYVSCNCPPGHLYTGSGPQGDPTEGSCEEVRFLQLPTRPLYTRSGPHSDPTEGSYGENSFSRCPPGRLYTGSGPQSGPTESSMRSSTLLAAAHPVQGEVSFEVAVQSRSDCRWLQLAMLTLGQGLVRRPQLC